MSKESPPPEDERPGSPYAYSMNGTELPSTNRRSGTRTSTKVNRRINTCGPCQQAKRACDRSRPCKACKERKTEARCLYAADATEPVDASWLQKKLVSQDNLILALYNALGVTTDQREAVARSEMEDNTMRVDLPALERRRGERVLPAPMTKLPGMHMTLFAVPPQGVDLDPATVVFGNNSIFCPLDDLLGPWSETLGTIMRAYPIHDPNSSPTFANRESSDNTFVHMAASHSELEPRNLTAKASSNLAPLKLAYQLFIAPSLFSQGTGEENGHRLVTPAHVSHLPSSPLREELWKEFESMTVLHNGLITPELKRRVETMFAWAEAEKETGLCMDTRPDKGPAITPPTLAFFSVVCGALSIGAQSKECKLAHRQAGERAANGVDGGEMLGVHNTSPGSSASPNSPFSNRSKSSSPDTPPVSMAQDLHNLAIATRLAHDQMDLPPSLDYIFSHMLSWLYLLHPSNVVSLITDTPGTINGGGPFSPDARVWKELGKVVNVARTMGLGVDPDTPMMGNETHAMGVWEKEMRRRVWWELCWFDAYMSECMGHVPLIDREAYNTQLPSDVDESRFRPESTELPPPSGATTSHNLSHFVYKCRLVKLSKQLQRYSLDPADLEASITKARAYETEITQWKASLPSYLQIRGLPDTVDNSWNEKAPITYPASDIMGLQACHLYTMAGALIIRLWTPFLNPTLQNPQHHQYPSLACTTAANAIVTASNYVRKQFRAIRPANLGYYALGRSVYIAGCIASVVAIRGGPDLHFCETAVRAVKVAIEISKDPAVCGIGRPDPRTYRFETGRVLELMRLKAENTWKSGQVVAGSKRLNEGPQQEILKLRAGYELPYAGRGVVTTSCTLRLNYEPIKKTTIFLESEADGTSDDESRKRRNMNRGPLGAFRAPSPSAPAAPRPLLPAPPSASESESDTKSIAKAPGSASRPTKRRADSSSRQSSIVADSPSPSTGILSRAKSRSAEVLSTHARPQRKRSSADLYPPPAPSSRAVSNERAAHQPSPIVTSSPWKGPSQPSMDSAPPSAGPLTPAYYPGPAPQPGSNPMSPHAMAMSPGYENAFMPSIQHQMAQPGHTHTRTQSFPSTMPGPEAKFVTVGGQPNGLGTEATFNGGSSQGSWGNYNGAGMTDLSEASYAQPMQPTTQTPYQFDPSPFVMNGQGGQSQFIPPAQQQQQQQQQHAYVANGSQYHQQAQSNPPNGWSNDYANGGGMNMNGTEYNPMSQAYVQGGQQAQQQRWPNPNGGHQ